MLVTTEAETKIEKSIRSLWVTSPSLPKVEHAEGGDSDKAWASLRAAGRASLPSCPSPDSFVPSQHNRVHCVPVCYCRSLFKPRGTRWVLILLSCGAQGSYLLLTPEPKGERAETTLGNASLKRISYSWPLPNLKAQIAGFVSLLRPGSLCPSQAGP